MDFRSICALWRKLASIGYGENLIDAMLFWHDHTRGPLMRPKLGIW